MAEGGSSRDTDDMNSTRQSPKDPVVSRQTFHTGFAASSNMTVFVNSANVLTTGNVYIKNNRCAEPKPLKIKRKKPLTTCLEQPSRENIDYISDRLGSVWQRLGRCLGFEDATLDQIKMDNSGNSFEANYQMLIRWVEENGAQATKARLAKCFSDCGLGNLADYLGDH